MSDKNFGAWLRNSLSVLPKTDDDISTEREFSVYHTPYTYEKHVMEYFRTGDINGYRRLVVSFFSGSEKLWVGNTSDNELNRLRYIYITLGALAVRAVIDGGMPEIYAFTQSDIFIRKVDEATSIADFADAMLILDELLVQMNEMLKYLSDEPHVRRCQNYICQHLHDDISRSQLAQASGLSESRLSAVFKKETGMTMKEYTLCQKVIAAKRLLASTNISYSLISYQLGFSSQSHFTAVFRKYTDVTPHEYRLSTM